MNAKAKDKWHQKLIGSKGKHLFPQGRKPLIVFTQGLI